MAKTTRKTSVKQKKFISRYLLHGNATKAAKEARYSPRSASSIGEELLNKPEVAAQIAESLRKVTKKAELNAADVLTEIKRLAFMDLTKAFDKEGLLLPFDKMPRDVRKALASIETEEIYARREGRKIKIGVTRKIRIVDKVRSLEMLAKHFKLLTEVQEISGKDGGPQIIAYMPDNGRKINTSNDEK